MRISTFSLVALFVLVFQHTVNAQPDSVWARIFNAGGWDECSDMIATAEGGYALIGYTLDGEEFEEQFFLMTTDSDGNRTHHLSFGEGSMDMGATLLQQNNGSFLVGGWSHQSAANEQDFRLLCTDSNCNQQWSQVYGGHSQERCHSLIRNTDGNLIMAGHTSSFGNGQSDFWLVCVDASGDSLWSRTFGDSELQECYSAIEVSSGGYCLAGYTGSNSNDDDDFLIVKTDSEGNLIWQRTYGGDGREKCYSLVECSDGGFLLVGESSSFGAGGKDGWIIKVSASGDSLWSRTFGGAEEECFNSICLLPDGGFALGGRTDSFAEQASDLWLVRINHLGEQIWSQAFVGRSRHSWDECTKVIQLADGSFVLAGTTGNPPGEWQDSDFILYKTSPDPMSTHPRNVSIVEGFKLSAFPNPFNAVTTIRFSVPASQNTELTVYDLTGREVQTLLNAPTTQGTHEITFNGSDLSSGSYFVKLNCGEFSRTEQLILIK